MGKSRKKVLLFSTLNPFPFWAGSETYWFEFVREPKVHQTFDFHVVLADSPLTRAKGKELSELGIRSSFYKHFNVDFLKRNVYRIRDKIRPRPFKTLPWYDAIDSQNPDLVWFCVSTTNELLDLGYAVEKCAANSIPYWIVLQHSYESIFFSSDQAIELVKNVATGARSFIFIAERNRMTLERAIGQKLTNAFHSVNTLPAAKIKEAAKVASDYPVGSNGQASLFTLGRYSPRDKGHHLLVEALSQSQWRERNWKLSFVGVDEFGRSSLERLSRFFDVPEDRLNFVAFTDGVFAEIARHDVLLMPSLAEGTPYAMIESMACGRPAMGTPIGGIPELISNGETGWLARTIDVDDIETALENMWNDRSRWNEMGERGQRLVSAEYVSEQSAEKLLEQLIEDTSN